MLPKLGMKISNANKLFLQKAYQAKRQRDKEYQLAPHFAEVLPLNVDKAETDRFFVELFQFIVKFVSFGYRVAPIH